MCSGRTAANVPDVGVGDYHGDVGSEIFRTRIADRFRQRVSGALSGTIARADCAEYLRVILAA